MEGGRGGGKRAKRKTYRIEAMGLAMPLPSMSGAEPWTLQVGERGASLNEKGRLCLRFTHDEVVTGVDRGDEAEGTDEGGSAVTGMSGVLC